MGKGDKSSDLSPSTEASKLLEQALLQMDGIISGHTGSLNSPDYGFGSSPPGVREAANGLVTALRKTPAPPRPEPHIVAALMHWLQQPSEHDEKFRKLLYEKDNLQLQVQVLSEQIEAQGDKIAELEKHLQEKKHVISEAEDKLQREILSRSSLETQKLELMSIISDLKLQHAAIEKENMELRGACNNNELKKSLVLSRSSPQPQLTSTPLHSGNNQAISLRTSPSPSPVTSRLSDPTGNLPENQPPKTPPSNYKRQIDIHYGSLPRQQFLSNGGTLSNVDLNANPASVNGRKGVAFGRGIPYVVGFGYRGYSVPDLVL